MDGEVRFADVDTQVLLRVVEQLDGHTLLKPAWLVEQGLSEKLVKLHTRRYASDWSSPKTMIFGPDGKVVPQLEAVYSLDLLAAIAREFQLEAGECLGRGTQAAEYRRVIREHLAARTPITATA